MLQDTYSVGKDGEILEKIGRIYLIHSKKWSAFSLKDWNGFYYGTFVKVPVGDFSISVNKDTFHVQTGGLYSIPSLGIEQKPFRLSVDGTHISEKSEISIYISGELEDLGFLKSEIVLTNVSKKLMKKLNEVPALGNNTEIEVHIMSVVPSYIYVRFEPEGVLKEAIQSLKEDREFMNLLNEDLKSNSTLDRTLAETLLKMVEGRARGVELTVKNKNNLDITGLLGIFIMISGLDEKEALKLMEQYFDFDLRTY